MRIRTLAVAFATVFSGAALADSIDLNFNDDSIQATYAFQAPTYEISAGYLDNDDRDSWVASAGLLATGDNRIAGARADVGLGGKAYVVSVGSQDIYALGLGGQLRVFPAGAPIAIGGYAFYAPNILTSGDGEDYWEAGARVELEAIKNTASVYVGYRRSRAELENGGRVTVDSGVNLGLRINF